MRRLLCCLSLAVFVGIGGLGRTSQALAKSYPRQEAQIVEHCLKEATPSQVDIKGSLYYEKQSDNRVWRLRTDAASEAIILNPSTQGISLDAVANPLHTVLAVPARDHSLFYLIQQGKVIRSIRSDFNWEPPVIWTNNNHLVVNKDSPEPAENGFVVLELSQENPVGHTLQGFPSAMRVSEVPYSGFYVSPKEDSVVYGAHFAEGAVQVRGLAMADITSKQMLWSTRSNFLWDKSWSIPSWSPDGEQFAYVRQDHSTSRLNIALVNKMGEEQLMTHFQGDADYFAVITELRWSPDGRRLAFWMYDPFSLNQFGQHPEQQTLYILDLISGTLVNTCHRLAGYFEMGLIWSPDGTSLAYVFEKRLMVLDIANGLEAAFSLDALSLLGWLNE